MCVTSALRAASSQTQGGRSIYFLNTSALHQTVTEKLISHIFLNLFFFVCFLFCLFFFTSEACMFETEAFLYTYIKFHF